MSHINEDHNLLTPPQCFSSSSSFFQRGASSAIKLSLHCQTMTGCTNPRCCRSFADPSCQGGRSPGLKPMGHVPHHPIPLLQESKTIINSRLMARSDRKHFVGCEMQGTPHCFFQGFGGHQKEQCCCQATVLLDNLLQISSATLIYLQVFILLLRPLMEEWTVRDAVQHFFF